jgi:hypothetical protein
MTSTPRTPLAKSPAKSPAKAPAQPRATSSAKSRAKSRAGTRTEPTTVVRFPNNVLAYLSVAVEGPVGPGGIAHRIRRYPVTRIDEHGRRRDDQLVGAACGTTTTRPGPDHHPVDNPDDTETVPTVACRDHSASFAQHCGVTRCTRDACWPLRPDETPTGGTR